VAGGRRQDDGLFIEFGMGRHPRMAMILVGIDTFRSEPMRKTAISSLAAVLPAVAALLLAGSPAQAQHGHGGYHGSYHGGYHGYPGYHGGYGWYRPYGYYPGWYRPYPVFGIGIGFYAPYYGSYAYPLAPGALYNPYPATVIAGSSPQEPPLANPSAAPGQASSGEKPPADNAGHLQLFVPAGAEVFVDGQKISQTGTTREIVSPAVAPGSRYTYRISVRYTNADGKAVNDTRDITFQANDWFSIDFTRPAPPMAAPMASPMAAPMASPMPPAGSQPLPFPSQAK
jgi:uncharacterized protein (TIGR03000 family)